MKAKEQMYAVIGGCVGAVLTMVVCSFSPLGAQSENDAQFDTITCKDLKVVDPINGSIRVRLSTNEKQCGNVGVTGKNGTVLINTYEYGGAVVVTGGYGGVRIASDEHGTKVGVFGTDWSRPSTAVAVDKHGGAIAVRGRDKEVRAFMGVDENGNGTISTWDKEGSRVK